MELIIINERDNSTQKVDFRGKDLKELLQYLNINSETVLVIRNNLVITEEETLKDKDILTILSVVSGG